MQDQIEALTTIFTEFYYWVTVALMFLIHVGFSTYEIAAVRPKNMQRTLMKHLMVIPLVTITFFFFGWWLYNAIPGGPGISSGILEGAGETGAPWSELMAPQLQDRLNGVFWAAFLLFSWTAAAIVSGAVLERGRTAAFLILGTMVGSVTWVIDAAWGWHPEGWMVQIMGYHDAYASGVIHGVAGGAVLGVVVVLGPRIGKFGPRGEVRDIKPHNVWLSCVGLFIIYTGFWGFYVACNIPIANIGTGGVYFSATNIYGTPTTLSAITFNFLMSLSGGLLAAYLVSRGDPFWTFSGGLAGIIATSAGNDLYHPIQSMLLAAIGVVIIYKLHFWVERRFKIDDVVGAIAVHGYAGTFGVVVAGFMLWGYPAAAPVEGVTAWFTTPEGWPAVNPIGNLLGALIMFGVLGFLPAFALAKLLDAFGLLRVPRAVELMGLDAHEHSSAYPYFRGADAGDGTAADEIALAEAMSRGPDPSDGPRIDGALAREDRRS